MYPSLCKLLRLKCKHALDIHYIHSQSVHTLVMQIKLGEYEKLKVLYSILISWHILIIEL